MRTYAHNRIENTASSSPARANMMASPRARDAYPLQGASRAIGNGTAAFVHDFSRVPIFSEQASVGRSTTAGAIQSPRPEPRSMAAEESHQPRDNAGAVKPAENAHAVATTNDETASRAEASTITSRTTAHAPDGTTDTRWTVGVGEEIEFEISGGPIKKSADWEVSAGSPGPSKGQATFKWTAPEQPGTSKITARLPLFQGTCTRLMDVVAPEAITMEKRPDPVGGYPSSMAGAGMLLNLHIHPMNVSFDSIEFREDPGPPLAISGYFATTFKGDLYHHATPYWSPVLGTNQVKYRDKAASATLPKPWSSGFYIWEIPNRYRCVTSSGDGYVFAKTYQACFITDRGAVTVRKQSESVTRTLVG